VDFSDRSLGLPFSTRVRAVEGTVLGIASEAGGRATLELGGQIAEYGSAGAKGRLAPADPKSFTDIRVAFENVAMPPLSPYSATFAGRKIQSGRMWLDLHYAIEAGQLKGENKIRAADLRLGERVEAPDALDLPLDLAIAQLTGPDGQVHVAVPVSGDVGDPKFDYGRVIRRALASVITRVVSAPFRVLGRLVGGERVAELGTIGFDPGRAILAPAGRETLDKVAQALQERPRLQLVVHGPYDPDRDAQALRSAQARRAVATEQGLTVAPDRAPGPLDFADADTQRAIERVLRARAGREAVDAVTAAYAREQGKTPARASVLGGAGEAAFYAAMFRRLSELEQVPEDVLERLGSLRAAAIVEYMTDSAGLDAARIATGAVRTVQSRPDSDVVTALDLDVMPGA
jgi:hypothetical protein